MVRNSLKRKTLPAALGLCLTLATSGCAIFVAGSLGALGGYVASPDTVEGVITDTSYAEVWSAAIDVIAIMGVIEERNDVGGMLLCKVQGAKVTITIFRSTSDAIKISVKSRKAFFPKIKLSQDIYIKIVDHVIQRR